MSLEPDSVVQAMPQSSIGKMPAMELRTLGRSDLKVSAAAIRSRYQSIRYG
jgi:hypothetical protein